MSGSKTEGVFGKDDSSPMQPIVHDPARGDVQNPEAGHQEAQANPPTAEEFARLCELTDRFFDWLCEQGDVSEVSNHDGSILSFVLGGFGDVSVQFTPTGHTGL